MTLAATRIHTPCSERPGQSTRNRVDSHSSGMMICILEHYGTRTQARLRAAPRTKHVHIAPLAS